MDRATCFKEYNPKILDFIASKINQMKIEGKEYRTIWFENDVVKIIDQTKLPHQFVIKDLKTVEDQ